MTLDLAAVGHPFVGEPAGWTSDDLLLYAVGIGAGMDDPTSELGFTTENSIGVEQIAPPTFVSLLGGRVPPVGDIDLTNFFHAGQGLLLHRPVPVGGVVIPTYTVLGLDGKSSGVVVRTRTDLHLADTGELLASNSSDFFLRGQSLGSPTVGEPAPESTWAPPDREPDAVVELATRRGQALLYRLTGDRNPLHSDPEFARRAGFDRPILHGMCTFGFTSRALIQTLAGGDPTRLGAMRTRFTSPVLPGDRLTVQVWIDGPRARFQTLRGDGSVALDRGEAALIGS